MLGKFQIHPSARITIVPKKKYSFYNIVEPFQITEFLPRLLLGSSLIETIWQKVIFHILSMMILIL